MRQFLQAILGLATGLSGRVHLLDDVAGNNKYHAHDQEHSRELESLTKFVCLNHQCQLIHTSSVLACSATICLSDR